MTKKIRIINDRLEAAEEERFIQKLRAKELSEATAVDVSLENQQASFSKPDWLAFLEYIALLDTTRYSHLSLLLSEDIFPESSSIGRELDMLPVPLPSAVTNIVEALRKLFHTHTDKAERDELKLVIRPKP